MVKKRYQFRFRKVARIMNIAKSATDSEDAAALGKCCKSLAQS